MQMPAGSERPIRAAHRVTVATVTVAMLVSGCASPWGPQPTQEAALSTIEQIEHAARDANDDTQKKFEDRSSVVRLPRPLLLGREVSLRRPQLPAVFDQPVSFRSMGAQTLPEIMTSLSALVGVRVDWMEVLRESAAVTTGSGTLPSGAAAQDWTQQRMAYEFAGPLARLFDDLAARIDASWRYDDELARVVFYRFEQAILGVAVTPGSKQVSSSISIGGSGGGGGGGTGGAVGGAAGGGGSVSISSDFSIDPWKSLMDGVAVLLGRDASSAGSSALSGAASGASAGAGGDMVGGRHGYAVANRDLAQIIIVARPRVLAQVRQYVDQTNRRFARNTLIDVRVIEIQNNHSSGSALSAQGVLDLIRSSGALRSFNLTLGPSSLGTAGVQSVQLGAGAVAGGRVDITLDTLISAIQSVSRTTVRNQGQIVAINGQPASFQQANQISYLSRVQTSTTPNVGTQTAREPGTVTVGFTANFIPTVMADGRVMLQYQIQSSSLVGLKTVGDAQSFIQVPEIYNQSLQQQAYLRDGEILMLFGFGRDRAEDGESREIFGRGQNASANRSLTAVIIQVRTDAKT